MGARNGPLNNLIPIDMKPYATQIGIYDKESDQDGWCKIVFDLLQIEAVRPFINDHNKYEHTFLYFKSGLEIMIIDDYDDFCKVWLAAIKN
jgi:hypothetical protein